MRQFNKFKGTKGFIVMWERVLRFRYMITEQAKRRCKILAFWKKYGNAATKEAFGTSRATLFRWQKELSKGNGKLEALNAKSTAPKNKRKRIIPKAVEDLIMKERAMDPHISKDKLSVLIKGDRVGSQSLVAWTNLAHEVYLYAITREVSYVVDGCIYLTCCNKYVSFRSDSIRLKDCFLEQAACCRKVIETAG